MCFLKLGCLETISITSVIINKFAMVHESSKDRTIPNVGFTLTQLNWAILGYG